MSFYIGVDGGGTKTQYALFNEKKEMLSSVKTAGSNHENLEGAIPEAAGIIMGGINDLLKEIRNLTVVSNILNVCLKIIHHLGNLKVCTAVTGALK